VEPADAPVLGDHLITSSGKMMVSYTLLHFIKGIRQNPSSFEK
jgi:hypothetical protein